VRSELDDLLEPAAADIARFRGTRLAITGGTGFVGHNLLESIMWANDRLKTGLQAIVIARSPERFLAGRPDLETRTDIAFFRADVCTCPELSADVVVHAATPASAALNAERPLEMLDNIVDGTKHVLARAAENGRIPFVFTSSGAVYGKQSPELAHRLETDEQGPNPLATGSAYAEGKRVAELQSALYAGAAKLDVKIARLFAFIGPHLPLDRHFAAGNFVDDALRGRDIHVRGDGSTVRSYLYATEMIVWLWAIAARGSVGRAYNVGSEEAVSMRGLAEAIAAQAPRPTRVRIAGHAAEGIPVDRYVPSTERIRTELGVAQRLDLGEAIRRTLDFYG